MNLKYSLCRTCLSTIEENEKFNIFDTEELADKIILCSGLPVENSDEFPINVCLQCYEETLRVYEFQQMCSKSRKEFIVLLRAYEERCSVNSLNDNCIHNVNVLEVYIEEKKRSVLPKKKHKENINTSELLHPYALIVTQVEPTDSLLQRPFLCDNSYDPDQTECELDKNESDTDGLQYCPLLLENNCEPKSTEYGLDQIESVTDGLLHSPSLCESSTKPKRTEFEPDKTASDVNRPLEIEEEKHSKTNSTDSSKGLKSVRQCDRCDQSFNSAKHLKVHKRQHDGSPPYTCAYEGCTKSFNRWPLFNKHRKAHNCKKDDMHKCDVENCGRVYKNKCHLIMHKRQCHNYGPELKPHMCEICGKFFKSRKSLVSHGYTHIDMNQLPYPCEEEGCSKRFSTRHNLELHKIRHAGIKNYICPHCGLRKATPYELKRHINFHTLEKTWWCRFCPKVFKSSSNMISHIKAVHEGAKKFACSFCERKFARSDTKKRHERTHTGEKPNVCEMCGSRFAELGALKTHIKRHLNPKSKKFKIQTVNEIDAKNQVQNTKLIQKTDMK